MGGLVGSLGLPPRVPRKYQTCCGASPCSALLAALCAASRAQLDLSSHLLRRTSLCSAMLAALCAAARAQLDLSSHLLRRTSLRSALLAAPKTLCFLVRSASALASYIAAMENTIHVKSILPSCLRPAGQYQTDCPCLVEFCKTGYV